MKINLFVDYGNKGIGRHNDFIAFFDVQDDFPKASIQSDTETGFDSHSDRPESRKSRGTKARKMSRSYAALRIEQLEDRRLLAGLTTADLPTGLVASWNMESLNNTIPDAYGGNQGTAFNSPGITDGFIGRARSFDGVNDYVDFGDVLDIERTQPFTYDFWIRMDASVAGGRFIIAKQDNQNPADQRNATGYVIQSGGTGSVDFFLIHNRSGNEPNWLGVRGETVIRDGQYHHVAGRDPG